jgi:hypothetical protein
MPTPTLVTAVQIDSPWAQVFNIDLGVATKNYASTLSTQSGDLIVAAQGTANANSSGILTTTTTGLTYTQRTASDDTNYCSLNIATAPDGAGGTRTIVLNRVTTTTTLDVGGVALQFRGHGGVGNVLTYALGVQTGNLTCSANSAVVVICLDWNATAGTRTWATVNGQNPTATYGVDGDASTWAAAVAYFADVGAAGSKTLTLSSPTFSKATFAAIEILAESDAAPRIVTPIIAVSMR